MKAVVLGAGLVGVTTAYELLSDGWDVTVIDREDGPARFTSFANAGLFAPGHAYAWSSPQAPGILIKSLVRGDQDPGHIQRSPVNKGSALPTPSAGFQ